MIETKLALLRVTCEGCETEKHVPFLKNREGLACDTCGQVRARVTFDIEGGLKDEN